MQINIKADTKRLAKDIDAIHKRQIPFATHRAINATLFDVQRELKRQAPNKIDRPTPFTLRGFQVIKSKNKQNLTGEVYFNRKYAEIIVEGGMQTPDAGRSAFLTPTKYKKKNRYGNISKAQMSKIKTDKAKYFFGVPKGRTGSAYAGVWERIGKNPTKKIRQVARYEGGRSRPKTLPFYLIAQGKAQAVFDGHFSNELAKAIRNAR